RSKTLVNKDPNTIIVLGKGFITHGGVLSVGPVLAIEDAHIMGSLTAAGPALFVEKSFPRMQIKAAPLLAEAGASNTQDKEVEARLVVGDFGWRRPAGWPKRPAIDLKGPLPRLAAVDAKKKRADLLAEIKLATGTDTKDVCKPTANPLG